jgi:predicted AAA+ superfamily ATPase
MLSGSIFLLYSAKLQYKVNLAEDLENLPMYVPRTIEPFVKSASEQFPVLLVTGARQVGKTTFLQHLSRGGREYGTLDDPGIRELAKEDPALFFQRFTPPVLIDEIQYASELLPYGSYVQTYLQRDVRDLARVGDEMAFLRFLRASAARSAQLLNMAELARDADIGFNTAKSWISILQSSGIVYRKTP